MKFRFSRAITMILLLSIPTLGLGASKIVAHDQPLISSTRLSSRSVFPGAYQRRQRRDKVLKTLTTLGQFVRFDVGDYVHLVVKTAKGKEMGLWLSNDAATNFVVAHKDQMLTLTYQRVRTYIPEAGGYEIIEQLTDARSDTETASQWWAKIKANPKARKKIEKETEALMYATQ